MISTNSRKFSDNWYSTTVCRNLVYEVLICCATSENKKYMDGSKYHDTEIHGLEFVHGI